MRLTSLTARSREAEQMDDSSLDLATFAAVLGDLEVVNRWTLASRPTLSFLRRSSATRSSFRLLDVGCGSGDMLRAIRRWADRLRIRAELVGVDRDPRSAPVAIAATPPSMGIDFVTGDYENLPGRFDFIVSSLVAHHMSESEIVRFIQFMEANASGGWLINDLHRRAMALLLYPLLASALRIHSIVRSDGMLSVARSFRAEDWQSLLERAGLSTDGARIIPYFPFRLCVERRF